MGLPFVNSAGARADSISRGVPPHPLARRRIHPGQALVARHQTGNRCEGQEDCFSILGCGATQEYHHDCCRWVMHEAPIQPANKCTLETIQVLPVRGPAQPHLFLLQEGTHSSGLCLRVLACRACCGLMVLCETLSVRGLSVRHECPLALRLLVTPAQACRRTLALRPHKLVGMHAAQVVQLCTCSVNEFRPCQRSLAPARSSRNL